MIELIKTNFETLKELQSKLDIRYFLNQDARFGKSKEDEGNKVTYLYFKKDEEIIGFTIIVYYQYKKFFLKAKSIWGPCFIPNIAIEDFTEVLLKLKHLTKKTLRCLSFNISPLLHKHLYSDVNIIEKDVSQKYIDAMENIGIKQIPGSVYDNLELSMDTIYSKNVENMSYDDILKSVDTRLRTSIKKSIKDQVKVRLLSYNELHKYAQAEKASVETRDFKLITPLSLYQRYYNYFKEDVLFPCAYINCDDSINSLLNQIKTIEENQEKLNEKYKNNLENKKYKNITNDNNTMIQGFSKNIEKLNELQNKYGNVIELAYTCHIISKNELIYFTSCEKKELKFLNGTPAIHSYIFDLASKRNIKIYNLLGCSGDTSENAVDYGVLKFKQTFNGNFEKFIGTFKVF